MDDSNAQTPQNRRERRKQPKYFGLRRPDRSGSQAKTLLELAEERQKSLFKAAEERHREPAQGGAEGVTAYQDEPIGPLGEAIVYTMTMAMLHFTLDVLVYNQYGEEIKWRSIFNRTAQAIPVILILVYSLHRRASWTITQVFFLVLSTLSGCYLIHAANVYGYLAVMKRAPPLGTLWVWSVIELKLPLALLSLGFAVGFLQWGNYSIF